MQPTTGRTPVPSPSGKPLTRTVFIENADIQLQTWELRLDHVAGEANRLPAESRKVVEGRVAELRRKLSLAHDQLQEIMEAPIRQWDELRPPFEATRDEITEIFNRTDPPGERA